MHKEVKRHSWQEARREKYNTTHYQHNTHTYTHCLCLYCGLENIFTATVVDQCVVFHFSGKVGFVDETFEQRVTETHRREKWSLCSSCVMGGISITFHSQTKAQHAQRSAADSKPSSQETQWLVTGGEAQVSLTKWTELLQSQSPGSDKLTHSQCNSTVVGVITNTCDSPALTGRGVCCEKGRLSNTELCARCVLCVVFLPCVSSKLHCLLWGPVMQVMKLIRFIPGCSFCVCS